VTEARGAAFIDIIVATSICVLMAAIAVPVIGGTLDRERTIIGARYLAGLLQRARLESLKRARPVAVRVEVIGDRTQLRLFADGNGNGVRRTISITHRPAVDADGWLDEQTRDISLHQSERDRRVSVMTLEPGDDPLRIGNTSPDPVLSAVRRAYVYVAAHRGPQMAIRVFGATGVSAC
jgi:hypothetical protein